MSWWNRFGSSLFFAIVVTAVYPIYTCLAEPVLGIEIAFSGYLLATAAVYLFGIAPHPTRGLAAGVAIVGCGAAFALAGATGTQLALLTGLLVGVFRSGLLPCGGRSEVHEFARRFVRELGFIGVGLALAYSLAHAAASPGAWAFWGFYLVQSGFFLLGGSAARDRSRQSSKTAPDAFARAVRRAREVLAERRTRPLRT